MAKKIRTRICLKDIYEYIVTGKSTPILGLTTFEANKKEISVIYEGERKVKRFKAHDEYSRRIAIKTINKYISEVH